jgi:hypothetical protein
MKPLGGDRYQIGAVVVDKGAKRFSIPGRVLVVGKPLEYLATAPGGWKAYETLLEVDTTGSEFNLACILVGLERDPKLGPVMRSNQTPLPAARIALSIAWSEGGKRRQISAAEAILNPESGVKPEAVQWVYTGAGGLDPSGGFAPDLTGTLIGFVHDPNCIIESVVGIGVGAYGSVRGSAARATGRLGGRADRRRRARRQVIAARWGMLLVAAASILAAWSATRRSRASSSLRVEVTAVVGLLAPLFWPGRAATASRTALRVLAWSAAATAAGAASSSSIRRNRGRASSRRARC